MVDCTPTIQVNGHATLRSDLAKSYASHTLFNGVGVQLSEADRVGIIGPNGAGKSTLLKILAGLESARINASNARSTPRGFA